MTYRCAWPRRECFPRFGVNFKFPLTINGLDHLHLALPALLFVGANDHLDQLVPHDVFVSEVNKLDSFDVRENALRFDETAAFAGRQIDLRYVAGDHGLRAETDAREK